LTQGYKPAESFGLLVFHKHDFAGCFGRVTARSVITVQNASNSLWAMA